MYTLIAFTLSINIFIWHCSCSAMGISILEFSKIALNSTQVHLRAFGIKLIGLTENAGKFSNVSVLFWFWNFLALRSSFSLESIYELLFLIS